MRNIYTYRDKERKKHIRGEEKIKINMERKKTKTHTGRKKKKA
jgi:hypothetical protein